MRRAAAALLAILTLFLPVLADGEASARGPEDFVAEIMEGGYGFSEANYAVGFMSLYDGETWFHNADEYFKVASVYKLPLNMYFYELENAGELAPDAIVGGVRLEQAHLYSLEFSNNEISERMLDYLGGYAQYKRDILKYIGGAAEDVTDEYYYDNAFTAEMVLNILGYLNAHSDEFEEQLEHMLAAQPDQYLKSGELGAPIAQKYGYERYDGVLHVAVAGIVYAEEPFLLTILTRGSYAAVDAMGELCDAFAEWEAGRAAALRAEAEALEAERLAEEARERERAELEGIVRDCVGAALSASPLPAGLPWPRLNGALFE